MKKYIAVTVLSLSLAILSLAVGCSDIHGKGDNPDRSDHSNSSSSFTSSITDSSESSSAPKTSQSANIESTAPEPQKPDGEPTFLTLLDGTPIYTSQISEVYKGDEEWGTKEAITFEQAEQAARDGGDFSVKCDGFAYGFIPEKTLNCIDDPKMFKADDDRTSFEFLGEQYDVNEDTGKYSTDYIRIEPGDKFGPLTVKSAYTLFTRKIRYEGEDFTDVPGIYLSDSQVEFDGEIEMTGYVNITKMNTLYGEGGDMMFIPAGNSSTILPDFDYYLNRNARCICHITYAGYSGYCGMSYDIGNMYKVDCDTSGLNPGDSFVKVKVVLDDVKYLSGHLGRWKVQLKSIEII